MGNGRALRRGRHRFLPTTISKLRCPARTWVSYAVSVFSSSKRLQAVDLRIPSDAQKNGLQLIEIGKAKSQVCS